MATKTKSFLLRLAPETYDEVKKQADASNMSVNSFVVNAIDIAVIATPSVTLGNVAYASAVNNSVVRGLVSDLRVGYSGSRYESSLEALAGNPQEETDGKEEEQQE